MKVGSLFSGYGGLDVAVEQHFGAETVWHAEFEDAPSKVLAHHWPGVPNHHDVSLMDWATVEPVDIITGGFPCQDVSMAGKRAGMVEGTRSNLWGAMRTAIETIRPQYAVIENVRGLLSATAQSDSDLEQYPGFMGDESNVTLRAIGRVLGDLADIGYDAQWYGLRAADIGAPHGRYRVFILAWDAQINASQIRDHEIRDSGSQVPTRGPNSTSTDTRRLRRDQGRLAGPGQATGGQPLSEPIRRSRTQAPAYPESRGRRDALSDDQRQTSREVNPPGNDSPTTGRPSGASEVTTANTGSATIGQQPRGSSAKEARTGGSDGLSDHCGEQPATNWGPYQPAIRRWERSLGRTAPVPTELSAKGNPQLSPAFVEWMMGLNEGHVTSIDGISRANQLKMLGNGVVPQQALAALQHMTRVMSD